MIIPPKYKLTPVISKFLQAIEANKAVVESMTINKKIEQNIRRQSTLKSALYSARIEGNRLLPEDIEMEDDKNREKIEVFNLLEALEKITKFSKRKHTLDLKYILELHNIAMKRLSSDSGKIRKEVNAIFNMAGIAVYMPPPPQRIYQLLNKILEYLNSTNQEFIPVKAALAHYAFEKIHPFLDGNGRVGRLLLHTILHQGGYGMKMILPLEKYLDENRPRYYRHLEESSKDVTGYLEFMLEAIAHTAIETKELLSSKQNASKEDFLLPRRAEIFRIIKDQKMVQFDQIRRRFNKISDRMLRFDLKKLHDAGFIKKLGTTKGVYYVFENNFKK